MSAFTPSASPSHPASELPIPGAVWGAYPRRAATRIGVSPRGWPERLAARLGVQLAALHDSLRSGTGQRRLASTLAAVRDHQAAWLAMSPDLARHRLANLRARLSRDGLQGDVLAEALGCVAATGERVLGRSPYDTQLQTASILLDNRLAEMATGEGKTYAAGIAAAVAALSGVPVHVITANDYLAARDAQTLAPLYEALNLHVGTVTSGSDLDHRRAAYACPVTYCTAREVAFDHLRDELSGASTTSFETSFSHAAAAARPLLRGLCMAIVDEADSVLIDEATLPLILSEPVADPQQRATSFQAMAAARPLCEHADYLIHRDERRIELTEAGLDRLNATAPAQGAAKPSVWMHPRVRRDLTVVALEALHVMQRDRDYVVRDGSVQLLDAITGRTAQGRVWSRGLQTMVELKEGCKPSPATVTRAQITYQRFFPRYLRLCGMSGTLNEAAPELRSTYRLAVSTVAARQPSRAQALPRRLFMNAEARCRAAARRVAKLHRTGRPVLVGTDSLAESQAMSALLVDAGIAHRVLDAKHDADEAPIVAAAGRSEE
ncbi:MAG: hypothetical protein JWQ11_3865, partial [Rhizobacter sp.]|nr:hypothetical protein [Rhizobacter sp.]